MHLFVASYLKGKLKEALRPVEKTLWSMQIGMSRESKISRYIQVRFMWNDFYNLIFIFLL